MAKITGAEPQSEEDTIMKKNILGAAVLAAILASGALSACSGSPKETTAAATETRAAVPGQRIPRPQRRRPRRPVQN